MEAAYPGDPSPGGVQKGCWVYSALSSVLNLSRPEDSFISKGWSQGEPSLMTGTGKETGHCNNGCHMLRSEVRAQTRLLDNWKFWEGFLEEVTAVYGLNNDEGSA